MILLPQDRESAFLEVWQDGERIWNGAVDCTEGSKSLEFTASGESAVEVYLDRVEVFNRTIAIKPDDTPLELELNLEMLTPHDNAYEIPGLENQDGGNQTESEPESETGNQAESPSGTENADGSENNNNNNNNNNQDGTNDGGNNDNGNNIEKPDENENQNENESENQTESESVNDENNNQDNNNENADELPTSWIGSDIIAEE